MTGPRLPREFPVEHPELTVHPEISNLLREAALALIPVLIAFLTRILTKGK
jgi:hypothetical protein